MMDCTARWGAIMGVGLLYRIDSLRPELLTNLENSEASNSPVPAHDTHLPSQDVPEMRAKAVQECVTAAVQGPAI